jgi:anti-sigma B factor antagonist
VPLPELEIRQEDSDGRVLIAVSGEIDMATVGGLRDALARAREAPVWIDLTDVDFMDSTGLTALVAAHQEIELTVICPDGGPVYRAIEVSGLDEVLRVRSSRAAAAAG